MKNFIMYDMSNIFHGTVYEYCSRTGENVIDIETFRGLILDRINSYNIKFRKNVDTNVFLVFDSRRYWKTNLFPYYKFKRKKVKEESKIDWNTLYSHWNTIKDEFKINLPFYCLELDGAEADDIFAAIVFRYHDIAKSIIIVSSDEDLLQLHKIANNIKQFSLKRKDYITVENTNYNLFEHIIKGDAGDGIPNVLSPLDTFYTETRQKNTSKKDIEKWKYYGVNKPEKFCKDNIMLERFKMNKLLIDFNEIPLEMINNIDELYENYVLPKGKLFNYLIEHKLTRLMDSLK